MVSEPDYIVAQGTGIPSLDGTWFDRAQMLENQAARQVVCPTPKIQEYPDVSKVELHPTGMIDVRDDGAVAEIWAPKDWKVPTE